MSILTDFALPHAQVPASDEQVLERRKEVRLSVNVPVTVTVLGARSEAILKAQVLDFSDKGMRVSVLLPIAAGSPVQVDANDALFLGEVCYSDTVDGGYIVGLTLSHSLTPLAELECLTRTLTDKQAKTASAPGKSLADTNGTGSQKDAL